MSLVLKYVLPTLVGLLSGFSLAWYIQSQKRQAEVAILKQSYAEEQQLLTLQAVNQLHIELTHMASVAQRTAELGPQLESQIRALTRSLKDAPALPADCRPDTIRVRQLTDAVNITNQATAR